LLIPVLTYHVLFTTYGFWPPNDPRGSWSDFVRSWELLRFGPATKVNTRRSVAGAAHDAEHRRRAKRAMPHPAVQLNDEQAQQVGNGRSGRWSTI